jgi:hypothetical protein
VIESGRREEEVFGDVLRKNVLQKDLVDAAHDLHVRLFDTQAGPPQEVRAGGALEAAVAPMEAQDERRAEEVEFWGVGGERVVT